MNLRDTILAADDRPITPVEVPEWGVTVYVATLTVEDINAPAHKDRTFTDIALLTLTGEDKAVVFTEADLPALKKKSFRAVNRVLDTFLDANGLGKAAAEKASKN